jgi:hypothetical protein
MSGSEEEMFLASNAGFEIVSAFDPIARAVVVSGDCLDSLLVCPDGVCRYE